VFRRQGDARRGARRGRVGWASASLATSVVVAASIWSGQLVPVALELTAHVDTIGTVRAGHLRAGPRLRQRTELVVHTVAAYRSSVSGGGLDAEVVQDIEAIPHRVKFDVDYVQQDDPHYPGHWGSYDQDLRTVFIGDKTRGHPDVIRYVVDHETAHAFYWQVLSDAERAAVDGTLGGPPGVLPKEAFADCVAKLWGSPPLYAYWDCPAEALAYVRAVVDR